MNQEPILLFDGECTLCNGLVQFIIRWDKTASFRFAPLQSAAGQRLLTQQGVRVMALSTMVLLRAGRSYTQSDAALEVAQLLGGPWRVLYLLRFLPRGLRDGLYAFVARHRHQFFGKPSACWLPTPALRGRFFS